LTGSLFGLQRVRVKNNVDQVSIWHTLTALSPC
jgi:hypothetical protein